MILLDEPSAGLSPVLQDQVFLRVREINQAGVSVVMVEQNARRCLQICHRGYVLDQGTNAYTDTGRLVDDPKVVELYLGTLARGALIAEPPLHRHLALTWTAARSRPRPTPREPPWVRPPFYVRKESRSESACGGEDVIEYLRRVRAAASPAWVLIRNVAEDGSPASTK